MTNEIITELKTFQTATQGGLTKLEKRLDQIEAEWSRGSMGGGTSDRGAKDLAALLWDSDDFQSWRKMAKGRFAVQFAPEQFKSAVVSSDFAATSSNWSSDRQQQIIAPPSRRVRVRDLMPNFPTSAGLVEYLREQSFTNAASPVAETVSKPESSIQFTVEIAPVKTIAHLVPVAKQAMDDVSAMRAYLGARMTSKLRDVEDIELLTGDGTGQHLDGLLTVAAAYETDRNTAGDTRLDRLSHAFSQLEESDFTPSGVVLNPADWRAISLLKDETGGTNKGAYLMGAPTSAVTPNVWGVSVATSTAMPRGYFLVADFPAAAAVFDRQPPTIEISDSHADYFQRNLLAVRCEERVSLAIWNAGGLIYGAF